MKVRGDRDIGVYDVYMSTAGLQDICMMFGGGGGRVSLDMMMYKLFHRLDVPRCTSLEWNDLGTMGGLCQQIPDSRGTLQPAASANCWLAVPIDVGRRHKHVTERIGQPRPTLGR